MVFESKLCKSCCCGMKQCCCGMMQYVAEMSYFYFKWLPLMSGVLSSLAGIQVIESTRIPPVRSLFYRHTAIKDYL